MRQPLWAINSSLLFFCILGQLVFLLIRTPIPRKTSIEPDTVPFIDKKINATVDISRIYGANDLFDTYVPISSLPKAIVPDIPPMPDAPHIIPLAIPVETPKVFIAPLPVVLKGVMYLHDRPEQSVAIVQFQDSKEEINYHTGQLINDAQILKIYPNRIIVVRANGQRETLYLREDDAGKDLARDTAKNIATLNISMKNGVYQIPVETFISNIKGLGQFIDLMHLTTVYKKGKSVGCRIGKAEKDSLASKLGFMPEDIIQQVDNLPVTDIASRVLVFDHTVGKKIGDQIHVQIERAGSLTTLNYELIHAPDKSNVSLMPVTAKTTTAAKNAQTENGPVLDQQMLYNLEEARKKTLEQKVKLAPTAHQLALDERKKMFDARRKELIASGQNNLTNNHTALHNFSGAKG
jgi:type II secretory pathway component PulC